MRTDVHRKFGHVLQGTTMVVRTSMGRGRGRNRRRTRKSGQKTWIQLIIIGIRYTKKDLLLVWPSVYIVVLPMVHGQFVLCQEGLSDQASHADAGAELGSGLADSGFAGTGIRGLERLRDPKGHSYFLGLIRAMCSIIRYLD